MANRILAVPKNLGRQTLHFDTTGAAMRFFKLSAKKFNFLMSEGLPAWTVPTAKNPVPEAYFLDYELEK